MERLRRNYNIKCEYSPVIAQLCKPQVCTSKWYAAIVTAAI